jgi:hypothetical protein
MLKVEGVTEVVAMAFAFLTPRTRITRLPRRIHEPSEPSRAYLFRHICVGMAITQ